MSFMQFRTTWFSFYGAAVALAFGAAGCGSGPFDEPEHVATWANTASPVAVYVHAFEPIAFADGKVATLDPACPATSDDGTTVEIAGGCTDKDGVAWLGTATIVRSGEDRTVTFDGYGKMPPLTEKATLRGTVAVRLTGPSMSEFDVDLVHEGGITTTIDYAGKIEGGYEGRTVWDGSGTVTRGGAAEPTGTVEATTTKETLDDAVCSGQAISGETILRSDGDEVVITYDGATDCDDDRAARWSLNGEDQGLVSQVVCSASAPGAGARPEPLAVLLLVMAGAVARRARRGSAV